jgi:hypothetical protein
MLPEASPTPRKGRETAEVVDEFVATFSQHMVDPDGDEMTTVFQDAGFRGAGTEVRFFGETHSPDAPHVFSSFYELESEDGARSVLDWLETDSKKPCPESCATLVSDFDVDDIPDVRGVNRLTTAEAIEAAGTPGQIPRDSYWWGSPSVHPPTRWSSRDLQDPSLCSKLGRSQAPITTGLQAASGAHRTPSRHVE